MTAGRQLKSANPMSQVMARKHLKYVQAPHSEVI